MEINILHTEVNFWEKKFAWLPQVIHELVKKPLGPDKEIIYDKVTTIVWLQPYYRRIEVQAMNNTWYWKLSATRPDGV